MSTIRNSIESKSDFLTGMYLITRIKDSDVDENALYTIQNDCPDFILPFNYKRINGYTEFTYKVGTLCKLQFFYGDITHPEYLALWKGILSPLLECRDWFMKTSGFVLNADYLYFNKNTNSVIYIYIPSVSGNSGYEDFSQMAVEVAKNMKVADAVLENNVLRSIINNFNPNEFLRMLVNYTENFKKNAVLEPAYSGIAKPHADDTDDDVEQKLKEQHGGFKLFTGINRKNKKAKRNGFKNTIPAALSMKAQPKSDDISSVTQEISIIAGAAALRCVGQASFPQIIDINVTDGGKFTIGRFDVSIGKKQSDFEFEARTKAVSRRHAAIERNGNIYNITDLSSSAGTYINDKKLPPSVPAPLEPGCRVSFGNLGADYVWECC